MSANPSALFAYVQIILYWSVVLRRSCFAKPFFLIFSALKTCIYYLHLLQLFNSIYRNRWTRLPMKNQLILSNGKYCIITALNSKSSSQSLSEITSKSEISQCNTRMSKCTSERSMREKNPCTVEIRNKLQATHTQAKTMLSDHNDGDMSNSFSGLERNTTQYELCSSYFRNTHVNSNRNWSQRTIMVLTTKFLLSSQQHFQTAFMTHALSIRCSSIKNRDVLWKDANKMTGQGWTTILQFPTIL